jgi:hypothetical protein
VVHLGLDASDEGGTVGGASNWYNFAFVVEEGNVDDHIALLFNHVLNEVLTVLHVTDLTRNFLFVGGLD